MPLALRILAFLAFVFAAMVMVGHFGEPISFATKAVLVGIFGLVGVAALIGAGVIEGIRARK